jgi:hypothetical protein
LGGFPQEVVGGFGRQLRRDRTRLIRTLRTGCG